MTINKKSVIPFEKSTKDVVTSTLKNLAEGLTGVAVSSRNDLILSISHIFQKMRGGQFLSAFLVEWESYREKGKIKEDYQISEQHHVCLQEMLEFLEKDSPSKIRFDVLKKIFLVAASEVHSDQESLLPMQYMKIARSLSDGEILLLSATWSIYKKSEPENEKIQHATEWLRKIAPVAGLEHIELIEIYENSLIEKKLLNSRLYGDRSGVKTAPYFRLTSLGHGLCSYIDFYE